MLLPRKSSVQHSDYLAATSQIQRVRFKLLGSYSLKIFHSHFSGGDAKLLERN